MATFRKSGSKEQIQNAINLAPYLTPILSAFRDGKIALGFAEQDMEPVHFPKPPNERPSILIVGDDSDQSFGPSAFHQSLGKFIELCGFGVIVACEPLPAAYLSAVTNALALQSNVVLVETRPPHETAWTNFVESHNPHIPMMIATVKPDGGPH